MPFRVQGQCDLNIPWPTMLATIGKQYRLDDAAGNTAVAAIRSTSGAKDLMRSTGARLALTAFLGLYTMWPFSHLMTWQSQLKLPRAFRNMVSGNVAAGVVMFDLVVIVSTTITCFAIFAFSVLKWIAPRKLVSVVVLALSCNAIGLIAFVDNFQELMPQVLLRPHLIIGHVAPALGVLTAAAVIYFLDGRRPVALQMAQREEWETWTSADAAQQVSGIGGWLLLFAVILALSTVRTLQGLYSLHWPLFRDGTWTILTDQDSAFYHPLRAPLVACELAVNVGNVLLAIATLVCVIRKSRSAPKIAIVWLSWNAGNGVVYYSLAQALPDLMDSSDPDELKQIVRSLIYAVVWIPYFMKSKRVRNTFGS